MVRLWIGEMGETGDVGSEGWLVVGRRSTRLQIVIPGKSDKDCDLHTIKDKYQTR